MKGDFTEFSYGYALTDNLRRSGMGEFTAAPVFPSLTAEGGPGGGYDLNVPLDGVPLLLQFKIPEVLTRSSARMPDGFVTPYYRMHLRPSRHSNQHALLMEHEAAGQRVFYAAPRFHTSNDLNELFLLDQVYHRSFLIAPSRVGELPDGNDHCVAYQGNVDGHEFQSKPRRLQGRFDSGYFESELRQTVPQTVTREETRSRLERLKQRTVDMVEQGRTGKFIDVRNAERMRALDPARGAAYVSQMFLDCELFIVARR